MHSIELDIISFIQTFRNPAFDLFFKCLNFFDRMEFFFVLIPALWFGKGWKSGLRMFYLFFLSGLSNHMLKEWFALPRPFHLDPTLAVIQVDGYGFPSGAGQTVILLSGILLQSWKSSWKWCVTFLYISLISFSRIYLGVHFPTDILGGWAVGFFLWLLFTYIRPLLEARLEKLTPFPLFCLSQFIPLLLFVCLPSTSMLRISACAMGMGIGLGINHWKRWDLPPAATKKEFTIKTILGSLSLFLCYFLLTLTPLPIFFSFLLLGLWIASGAFFLCRKLSFSTHPLQTKA